MSNPADDPMDKLVYLHEEINRLVRLLKEMVELPEKFKGRTDRPILDLFETPEKICVMAEVPGIDPDALGVYVYRDYLVLEGETADETRSDGKNYLCLEREFGKFCRVIEIPSTADTSHIRARYRNGLLAIVIPKIEDRRGRRRKIPLEVEDQDVEVIR